MKNRIALLLVVIAMTGIGTASAEWNLDTIDNSGDVGKWADLTYDSNGYPHVVYYNETINGLMYAKWDGNGWVIEELGRTGYIHPSDRYFGRYCAIALDNQDRPHVSFSEFYWTNSQSSSANTRLYYQTINPETGQWVRLVLASFQGSNHVARHYEYTKIALSYGLGQIIPHIIYRQTFENSLYYKYRHPQTQEWVTMPVDEGSNVGLWTDMVIDDDGNLYVSYYDQADKDCKFAFFNFYNQHWSTVIIDGHTPGHDCGMYTSICLSHSGLPHITYYDETNRDLRHATISAATMARLKARKTALHQQ